MVTGDHVATARAIAREIGLGGNSPRIIEGAAFEPGAARGADGFDVLARAVPAQKLDLISALPLKGEIVAVTGDGVNDVPALQGADIGIAMGERGTRTAREVASIVLLNNNYSTIVRAIAEGRQLFSNLKLELRLFAAHAYRSRGRRRAGALRGVPAPLSAHARRVARAHHPPHRAAGVSGAPTASDRLEPVDESQAAFFDWREWTLIAFIGLLVTGLVILGYVRSLGGNHDVEHARSMALVVLVVASATMTAGLSLLRSAAAVIAVIATIGSALVLVQVPASAGILHLSPLHGDDWLIAAAGGLLAGSLTTILPRLSRLSRERALSSGRARPASTSS